MSNIYNYAHTIDLQKHIFWQYNNAPGFNAIVNQKQDWYYKNHTKFWDNWLEDVLSISTANDYGLAIWGNLLQVPRTYLVNGVNETLTTKQYRILLMARLRLLRIRGTVPEINDFLAFLFKDYGKAYVEDGYDMTMTYHLIFNLTKLQKAVIQSINLLPRPAAVEINVYAVGKNVFGFNGSGCQPFDQAPFAVYTSIL